MSLAVSRLVALADEDRAPELLLIHGWGMSSVIWENWLPLLRAHFHVTLLDLPGYGLNANAALVDLDSLLALILEVAPQKAIYCGYSLGGMLSLKIAQQFPQRVVAAITLASNLKFVATAAWPLAMDAKTFEQFYQLVATRSQQGLKRFSGLQAGGDENEKVLIKHLRNHVEPIETQALIWSLDLLKQIDNSSQPDQPRVPVLYLFGENDQLVPVALANSVLQNNMNTVAVIEQAPHCFILSNLDQCWSQIRGFLVKYNLLPSDLLQNKLSGNKLAHNSFLKRDERLLDKREVARSFSRAAITYDSVAGLQRQVGDYLLSAMPAVQARRVLDLGCGTGYFSSRLQQQYPQSYLLGLDLAEGMVKHASNNHRADGWICADAENLPLYDNAFEVIFSSLAIQWCEDSEALFSEIYRVLKPGGYFVFSTLGPNTLHELRAAWQAVDNYIHVNRFVTRASLLQSMTGAGFNIDKTGLQWREDNIVLAYDKLKNLTRELKLLGAHNVNGGRPAGLTGRQRMRAFVAAYEQQRNQQGLLPATYQVWYGCLQKPLLSKEQHDGKA